MDFKTLLGCHPSYTHNEEPCVSAMGEPFFENQCAIKMGVALKRAKLDMSDYRGVRCWWHPESENHTLRVEELVKYLKKKLPKEILSVRKESDSIITHEDYEGLTGIIAFINFWGDNNQGDHIDLWNEDHLIDGDLDYFERSEKVYFWELD